MLENHLYNLHLQLTQEHKSLWRIKDHYKKDAEGCEKCQAFWDKMEQDKESHAQEISKLLKNH